MTTTRDDREPDGTTGSSGMVVVGVDAGRAARTAVRWAAREARPAGGRLRLVCGVAPPTYPIPGTWSGANGAVAAFVAARDALDDDGVYLEVSTVAAEGTAASVLVDAAGGADMLVIGRTGDGGRARLALGSTVAACATRSSVPVAVVPEHWDIDRRPRECVVLGVDGSPRCDAAVEYAFTRADRRGERIVAVHAVEMPAGYPRPEPLACDADWFDARTAETFDASLGPWREKFPGVDVMTTVEYEHPALALAEYVGSADAVVVGGRGRGLVTGMLLGSVARSVLRRLPCPVIVVRDTRG